MRLGFLSACACIALMVSPAPGFSAETLPLKRVTLSTSGLAQYEYLGSVNGNAQLEFPVRLDQVDDVLKSLVVLDDGGTFGGVSLPGREPLDQAFRDLPFGRDALQSPYMLLSALQGADVLITGPEVIKGKLVSVVPEQSIAKDDLILQRNRVTVMTAEGLRSAILEDLKSLQFTEPGVQDQLNRALAALHDYRVKDTRAVTLDLRGAGMRPVGVSYVTAAPVWKSAYRLVLRSKDKQSAYMQGWAILENTTGQDWDNVTMTLLSGNPVTYRQSLYESYYLDRPSLPLRVMDRLMPRTDEGAMDVAADKAPETMQRKALLEKSDLGNAAGIAMDSAVAMETFAAAAPMQAPAPMPAAAQMAAAPAAIAEQATAQMVFRFPQDVSLPAGHSMMLPVISRDIPAEQLWLYQPETNARHPLNAVMLTNDSDTGLPPGILTLFEDSAAGLRYTGDSELALLPKGEKRYITFALDPATTIDRDYDGQRQFGTITASKGMVRQKIVSTETVTYTIKAPADEDRTLVLEHPRRAGWDLVPPEGLAGEPEQSETHYRLRVDVKAGETKAIKIVLTHEEFETLSLGFMSPEDLNARLAAAGDDISAEVKQALTIASTLQADVHALQMQLSQVSQEQQTIFNDQERLRQNINSIPAGSDVAKRYLDELNKQEDRLTELAADRKALEKKLADAQYKLDNYIAGLEL